MLDPQQLQHAVDLRHQRCTLRRIAGAVGAPLSTVGRVMKALGLRRLRNLEPKVPVQRYQWEKPGVMIHVDTKQLARFERVGHRITGDRRQGCSRGASYEKVWRHPPPSLSHLLRSVEYHSSLILMEIGYPIQFFGISQESPRLIQSAQLFWDFSSSSGRLLLSQVLLPWLHSSWKRYQPHPIKIFIAR